LTKDRLYFNIREIFPGGEVLRANHGSQVLHHQLPPRQTEKEIAMAKVGSRTIRDLYIKNIDSQPITIKLLTEENNCYEGNVPLGQIWENLAPGSTIKITLARVQGHGCDGRQGEFTLEFTPGVGVKTKQHFDFDNGGNLGLTGGYPNQYPGSLSGKNRVNESYTYTTFQHPPVTAGEALGRWSLLCQQICNYSAQDARTTSQTTTKTYSDEEKRAIKTSLESKLEFEGVGSLTGTIETSYEKTIGHSMSESFQRGETWTDTRSYVYTPEQMRDLNIFALWQWIAETKLSTGEIVTVRSPKITCTPDANSPQYLPGMPQDLKACRNRN
jgi:hypothetical protein